MIIVRTAPPKSSKLVAKGVIAMNDLDDGRLRREAQLGRVASLEEALAAPASSAWWPEGVGNALSSLRTMLEEHVTATGARRDPRSGAQNERLDCPTRSTGSSTSTPQ